MLAMIDQTQGMLNINQLSRLVQTGPKTLRTLVHTGQLKCFRSNPRGKMLFRVGWFYEYVDRKVAECERQLGQQDDRVDRFMAELLREGV